MFYGFRQTRHRCRRRADQPRPAPRLQVAVRAVGEREGAERHGLHLRSEQRQSSTVDLSQRYVTFRLDFHHFDHFELDLRRHIHVRGAAFSCLRLKWADIVLI